MSIRVTPVHLVLGVLTATSALSCSLFKGAISQPPTMVERSWAVESLFTEEGTRKLDTPSVFVDEHGQPGFALANRAFTMGAQSIAVGEHSDEGWRVSFPEMDAPWRVCGRAEGDGVLVSHGETNGPLSAFTWDGTTTAPAEAGFCPELAPNRRFTEGPSGNDELELSNDGRTLWHKSEGQACPPHDVTPGFVIEQFAFAVGANGKPSAVVFERPDNDDEALGHLRHATCEGGAWTSSMIAPQSKVTAVGLALADDGTPHVVFVDESGGGSTLRHATPRNAAAPGDHDPRVQPAVDACARLWPAPPQGEGVEPFQSGDAFRCAVLQHAPETSAQALESSSSACSADNSTGCILAGSLHHWLMGRVSIVLEVPTDAGSRFQIEWSGLRANGIEADDAKAAAFFGKACDDGDARACMHQAFVLPGDDPKRLERATTACQAGLASACTLALAARGGRPTPELAAMAEPALRTACEGDDAASCNSLGVLLHVGGDAAGARTALDQACRAGLAQACDNLGRVPARQ
ncbi:MAG: hypothetical protein AAF799_41610 [Myxococcota bacterium]